MSSWRPWQHILFGFLLGAILVFGIVWVTSQPRGTPLLLEALPTSAPLQVHVAGAVREPGVYTISPGGRVAAAIERAGGMSADADTEAVNLAAILRDGMQVYVPRQGETRAPDLAADRAGLLDLNTAGLEDLLDLPGIGPDRAQDILDYRDQHGGFKQVEELMEIPGIGEATFERLESLVTVAP